MKVVDHLTITGRHVEQLKLHYYVQRTTVAVQRINLQVTYSKQFTVVNGFPAFLGMPAHAQTVCTSPFRD